MVSICWSTINAYNLTYWYHFIWGDSVETFDVNKTRAIFIQVRNRKEAASVDPFIDDSILPRKQRYLFLLFDLGIDKPSVTISQSNKKALWAVHSHGNDEQVFGCSNAMNVSSELSGLFDVETSRPGNKDISVSHYKDQLHNAIYRDRNSSGS